MGTWKFKSCPRCAGDMFIEKDMDGWLEQCMLCSYRNELEPIVGSIQKLSEVDKLRSVRGKK